ncbi:MAG: mechanosensitive ion channel [Microcoleaceae cyanobacterium MO_207.B10]|nr:mechanosensitive ion channel [Microcoleaceae cyanobacterium MO_207.B10]
MDSLQTFWETIQGINVIGLPAEKLLVAFGVLVLTFIFQGLIVGIIIKWIEGLAANTESDLDDQLIAIIKEPLKWLVFVGGVWIIDKILAPHLTAELNKFLTDILSLAIVALIALVIYQAAPVLGKVLEFLTLHTDTDLDDLLVPYLPRLFRTAAIVVIFIKGSEVFLGTSAGALIGLLGGAGVALGLLFKDIIYDWCCAVIIYTDRLYRPGDWVLVTGLSGFIQIVEIGLRTTKLYVWEWGSIVKMPNSRMVGGIVDNWSQDKDPEVEEWGFTGTLKIDGITADQLERIVAGIREIFKTLDGFYPNYAIMLRGIEGNSRVIKYVSYITPALYFSAATQFHLSVMRLMEKEGILAQNVYIITDQETYTQNLQMPKNN